MVFGVLSAVYASFDDYVAVEPLDGENMYDAGDYGLQVYPDRHTHTQTNYSNSCCACAPRVKYTLTQWAPLRH